MIFILSYFYCPHLSHMTRNINCYFFIFEKLKGLHAEILKQYLKIHVGARQAVSLN